jgi:tetratricopeptide (TPR) repeat protein
LLIEEALTWSYARMRGMAHAGFMPGNLKPPNEIWGFGSWLLWMIATRATALVDKLYKTRRANAGQRYGRVDGHGVPTPSVVAWLLLAAELGVAPEELPRTEAVRERQHTLRSLVSRAFAGEPQLFREEWLYDLAAICGFSTADLEFLLAHRYEVSRYDQEERANLRKAIEDTFRSKSPADPQPSGVVNALRALPRDTTPFIGRKPQLRRLMAAARSGTGVKVCAIVGMVGAGKTSLAIHAGHLLGERYPDGHIYLNLRGHSSEHPRVTPYEALATLLLTSGIAPQWIPQDVDARASLWRNHLRDKKVFLLLDDAVSSQQVRPLLPGTGDSFVLITSRSRLPALNEARQVISLDVMAHEDAIKLFIELADRRDVKAAHTAVADVVELCDYLPTAISLMARRLLNHPSWTINDLATALTTTQNRLAAMQAENISLSAAFDLSYQDLAEDEKRLFRRLGLHPGSMLDAYAAAALDGTDVTTALRHLEALYTNNLIKESTGGRFWLHSLVREYARSLTLLAVPEEDCAAIDRLLDYYLHAATAASRHLARREAIVGTVPSDSGAASLPPISRRSQATAWLRTELPNLSICVEHAAAHGRPAQAVQLVAALSDFLRDQGPWDQAQRLHESAVANAHASGDWIGEANAIINLGVMQRLNGDLAGAVASQDKACRLFRDLGHRQGQALALTEAGIAFRLSDNYEASTASLSEALELFGEMGDRQGQAGALSNLGFIQFMSGKLDIGIGTLTKAFEMHSEVGDVQGQAVALGYLGAAQRISADYPAATVSLTEALQLFRALGDRQGQANALNNLGVTQRISGDYPAATVSLTEALQLFRALGDRQGQANALNSLGVVQRMRGEYSAAADQHRRAFTLYHDLGIRLGQANALNFLGVIERLTGEYDAAISGHERALLIARDLDDLQHQADTLNFLGEVQRMLRNYEGAAASQNQALLIYNSTEPVDRQGQADALGALGRLRLDTGDKQAAAASLRQALDLYRLLGSQAGQAEILNSLGLLTSHSSDQQAEEYFTEAYDIASRIGMPLEKARALEGLGLCGASDRAARLWQALETYRRLGVPDRQRVEAILFP